MHAGCRYQHARLFLELAVGGEGHPQMRSVDRVGHGRLPWVEVEKVDMVDGFEDERMGPGHGWRRALQGIGGILKVRRVVRLLPSSAVGAESPFAPWTSLHGGSSARGPENERIQYHSFFLQTP
jgi:hypothetical protein